MVRDTVPIDLKQGINNVRFTETTAHLEPDSVILRDSTGKTNLQILEQNYRNDPVSQELLLSFFEGKTIDFLVVEPNKPNTIVQGKIVRSGYARHSQEAMQRYGQRYAMAQSAMAYQSGGMSQPIIEVDGKLRFALPGQPLFPPLGDDTILKPTIEWQLQADKAAKLDAELAYVTGGMSWEADYNIVAPEKSDLLDFVGWVTMDNQSGKTFENAKIKLMAGDVSKIQQAEGFALDRNEELAVSAAMAASGLRESVRRLSSLYPGATRDVARSRDETSRVHSRQRREIRAHLRLRRIEDRLEPVARLSNGKYPQQSGPRHGNGNESRGHARIQKFGSESSRHAAAERARPFLQTGR